MSQPDWDRFGMRPGEIEIEPSVTKSIRRASAAVAKSLARELRAGQQQALRRLRGRAGL